MKLVMRECRNARWGLQIEMQYTLRRSGRRVEKVDARGETRGRMNVQISGSRDLELQGTSQHQYCGELPLSSSRQTPSWRLI